MKVMQLDSKEHRFSLMFRFIGCSSESILLNVTTYNNNNIVYGTTYPDCGLRKVLSINMSHHPLKLTTSYIIIKSPTLVIRMIIYCVIVVLAKMPVALKTS